LPSVLLANGEIELDEKGEFEEDFQRFNSKQNRQRKLKVIPDWETFKLNHKNTTGEQLEETLLISPLNRGTKQYLDKLADQDLKEYCIQLMSLPEYQLC
jgi:hypothetical protein